MKKRTTSPAKVKRLNVKGSEKKRRDWMSTCVMWSLVVAVANGDGVAEDVAKVAASSEATAAEVVEVVGMATVVEEVMAGTFVVVTVAGVELVMVAPSMSPTPVLSRASEDNSISPLSTHDECHNATHYVLPKFNVPTAWYDHLKERNQKGEMRRR